MHPLVRILSLLLFAALVPWLPPVALAVAALALLAWCAASATTRRGAWRGVKRIRWLMLSIAILYLWFSPGEPLAPTLGRLSPTAEGARLALWRAGILLVMVGAAAGVLAGLQPREITEALRRLLGWPRQAPITMRFADRVGLLLADLPRVQSRVANALHGDETLARRTAALVGEVERQAADESLAPEPPLPLGPVPKLEWLLPVALAAGPLILFVAV